MKPAWIDMVHRELPHVTLRNLGGSGNKTQDLGGYQSKIEAICESSFNEVLFLDADSFPMSDPAYLFDHPLYRETGAVLWQDIRKWRHRQWKILNRTYRITLPKTQVESGQMIFDRRRVMPALERVRELNRNSAETYKVVYGDKDTFLIGFLQSGLPFTTNPHQAQVMLGGLLQPDLDGKPLFQHATSAKLTPDNLQQPRFPLVYHEPLLTIQTYNQMLKSITLPKGRGLSGD
jgi:hypothetical protein